MTGMLLAVYPFIPKQTARVKKMSRGWLVTCIAVKAVLARRSLFDLLVF